MNEQISKLSTYGDITQVSPKRREEHRDFIANISELAHLSKEVALLCEYVYTEVENGYTICQNQVTVWLFGNRKEGQGVISGVRNDEGAEPGQILLPEYMSEGQFQFVVAP
jgi:hypothetical protein